MPHNRDALLALAEKVRAAKGRDLELDAEILCALLAPAGSEVQQSRLNGAWCVFLPNGKLWQTPNPWRQEGASLTGSLDAALALFDASLPGWSREAGRSGFGPPAWCRAWDPMRSPGEGNSLRVDHASGREPLAVLLALLAGLLAQAEAGGQHVG